jgi:transcriptional regulator with XRE-family HTH domain
MDTPLKAARAAKGWSQLRLLVELEKAGQLHRLPMPERSSLKTQISRWENGHVTPHEPYITLLAEIYQALPADLGLDESTPETRLAELPALSAETVEVMNELLAGYVRADNAAGPSHLRAAVAAHLEGLEAQVVTAHGQLRRRVLEVCSNYAEFAGWLSQDAGDTQAALTFTARALDFLEEGGPPSARAYVLMRKSSIALDEHDYGRAMTLAEAACAESRAGTARLLALAFRQKAVACAAAGEERASCASVDEALSLDLQSDGGVHGYCTPAYVSMEAGVAAWHLRQYDVVVARLAAALESWPAGFERDRALCLARLALTEAVRGNLELSCSVGAEAVTLVAATGSARARALLRTLHGRLAPYDRTTLVSEFRGELKRLA